MDVIEPEGVVDDIKIWIVIFSGAVLPSNRLSWKGFCNYG